MRKGKIFLLAAGAIFLSFGVFLGVKAEETANTEPPVLVVAHRAGAYAAPENTMAALEMAYQKQVAIAEIDIQQLADGTLIVMHDSNFLRTAGIDKNVWEVTYEEIADYEVGGFFSDTYQGEKIPTLEQMLQYANDKIILMIEVKYTGYEVNLESLLLELLQKYQMERKCIIGSMKPEILQHIKELDKGISTVFIAHSLEEEQYNLEYVDSYSIQAENLTQEMVYRIHKQGKIVYAWTVNTTGMMNIAVKTGVDGIVTDDVYQTTLFLRQQRRKNALYNSIKTICHW